MEAEQMYPIHDARMCSRQLTAITDALHVIGGKWKLKIIIALSEGPARFNELQRTITGISARVLSNELKDMELNDFVIRTVYPDTPVIVEYSLTEYSKTVKPVIQALSEWGVNHRIKIMGPYKEAEMATPVN